jgi:probable phosphoglycerate mutase
MTHVYLIRHAQQFSAHNDQGLLLADHEDGLTEKGHAQARRMAERVANEIQPDVLYCSPLLRARQTARHVNDATGLPLNIDPSLAELHLSCPADVPTSVEFDGWVRARRYPYTPAFPGGEALADLQRRGAQAVDQIAPTQWNKSIVIITHGPDRNGLLYHWVFRSNAIWCRSCTAITPASFTGAGWRSRTSTWAAGI